jgi:hypothetical protein
MASCEYKFLFSQNSPNIEEASIPASGIKLRTEYSCTMDIAGYNRSSSDGRNPLKRTCEQSQNLLSTKVNMIISESNSSPTVLFSFTVATGPKEHVSSELPNLRLHLSLSFAISSSSDELIGTLHSPKVEPHVFCCRSSM